VKSTFVVSLFNLVFRLKGLKFESRIKPFKGLSLLFTELFLIKMQSNQSVQRLTATPGYNPDQPSAVMEELFRGIPQCLSPIILKMPALLRPPFVEFSVLNLPHMSFEVK
jgi:hypothetical protein